MVVTISMIVNVVTAVFESQYEENHDSFVVATIVESAYVLFCLAFLANTYTWTIC